jgi:DNA-binding response OmpR family regulator
MRIAVVDDDPAFLDLLAWLFADRGWDTIGFSADRKTLPRLIRARPDIAIVAAGLGPEQSGWHLLQMLETDPRGFQIPVIMCASKGELMDREDWLSQRGIAVVRKPLSIDQLYAAIEEIQVRPALHRQRQAGA